MSLEKPKTPPERVERFDAVYEIIPGSEDFPETETAFGGPHYTRNGLGRLTGLPVLVQLGRDISVFDKAFRTQVSEPAMGSFGVVMLSPILNDDAGFA